MEFCIHSLKKTAEDSNVNRNITFCDSTMRDGEQCNVHYSSSEKVELAKMLDSTGVQQIQIGMLVSESNLRDAKEICAIPLQADIEIMTKGSSVFWDKEVRQAVGFGADIVHSLFPISHFARGAYGEFLNDGEMLERAVQVTERAKKEGAKNINISLLDATRTEDSYIKELVLAVTEAGANRVCLADTVGCATPEQIAQMVKQTKKWLSEVGREKTVSLKIHVHDDFGLATANAMAAANAGADMLDTCINGMGKRAGNADMAQVVIGLQALCGFKTGINLEALYETCRFVERLSGVPIPENKPFIGALTFADDSEWHVRGLQEHPFGFQSILPVTWGNRRKIIIGKNSGITAIRLKMGELGICADDNSFCEKLLEACREKSISLPHGQYLLDQDIRRLAYVLTREEIEMK